MKNLQERVQDALDEMTTEDLVCIHNEYCSEANYMDDYIYSMQDFDEIMSGYSPWEVARAAYFGEHFNPCDDYFWFNGYANLESSDWCKERISTSDIADYIVRNMDALYNDEIQNILDEEDEEEELDDMEVSGHGIF